MNAHPLFARVAAVRARRPRTEPLRTAPRVLGWLLASALAGCAGPQARDAALPAVPVPAAWSQPAGAILLASGPA